MLALRISTRHQQGAVLIAALIILLLITMLGLATVDTTSLEMKMASNARDQQQAFEAAEQVLREVEQAIQENNFTDSELGNQGCTTTATNWCFNSACNNGYCFRGENATTVASCLPWDGTSNPKPWETSSIWSNAGTHRVFTGAPAGVAAKYIIEYRCFIPADPAFQLSGTNKAYLFRITAYAVGPAKRGRVMLQSTVKRL